MLNSLLFFLLLISNSGFTANNCYELAEALGSGVVVSGIESNLVAESFVKPNVKVKLEESLLQQYSDASIRIFFGNRIKGSKSITLLFPIKKDGTLLPLERDVELEIPKNVVGLYEWDMGSIRAEVKNDRPCYAGFKTENPVGFVVTNEYSKVDIYPPKLKDFKYENNNVKSGEKVSFTFIAEEKSPLCHLELEQAGKCGPTNKHQAFEGKGELSFDTFAPIKLESGNLYKVELTVPEDTKPGNYFLKIMNTYDVFGNASYDVSFWKPLIVSAP